MVREGRCLARRILLHAQSAIDDRKNVMRRKVIGIDRLHGLVLSPRLLILVLLIKRETKLAVRVTGTGKLRNHVEQIRDAASGWP